MTIGVVVSMPIDSAVESAERPFCYPLRSRRQMGQRHVVDRVSALVSEVHCCYDRRF